MSDIPLRRSAGSRSRKHANDRETQLRERTPKTKLKRQKDGVWTGKLSDNRHIYIACFLRPINIVNLRTSSICLRNQKSWDFEIWDYTTDTIFSASGHNTLKSALNAAELWSQENPESNGDRRL